MNSPARTALTIAVATAIPTAIVLLVLRPDEGPNFATQLAITSVESRLDEIEESLARLAEDAEERQEDRLRLAVRSERLAAEQAAADEIRDGSDDGFDENAYREESTLSSRVSVLETRLHALEEDPIQRGFLYLQSESAELRRQGLFALERIAKNDPVARQAIRDLLNDPDESVRVSTLDTLADIEDRESVGLAANLLADGSARVRREAIQTLARLGGADQGDRIAGLVSDEDPKVRETAADTLGKLKTASAAPSLLAALGDSSEDVRGQAISSLGEIGAKNSLPALRQIWETEPGPHRTRLLFAMRALGDEQPFREEVSRLSSEALRSESPDTRRRALRSLAYYSRDESRAVFEQALQDASPEVRQEAQRALSSRRR